VQTKSQFLMETSRLSLRSYEKEHWTIYDGELILIMFARDTPYKLVLAIFIAVQDFYDV